MAHIILSVVHNICNASNINIYLDDKPFLMNLEYREHSATFALPTNQPHMTVVNSETAEILTAGTLYCYPNNNYIVVISGYITECSNVRLSLHNNDMKLVPMGYAKIRFIQGAPMLGAVDILFDDKRIISELNYGDEGKFILVDLSTVSGSITTNIKTCGLETIVVGPYKLQLMSGSIYNIIISGCKHLALNLLSMNEISDITPYEFDYYGFMGSWWKIAMIEKDPGMLLYENIIYTPLDTGIKIMHIFGKEPCTNRLSKSITAKATIPNKQNHALWCVGDCYINEPNYIIHETDYISYAIIGTRDRSGLEILVRDQQFIDDKFLDILAQRIKSWGYDITHLKFINY